MAYNEKLANKMREALMNFPKVEEKHMFGGVCFMLNGKMCAGVMKEEMMCRIDPEMKEEALQKEGCRQMTFTGKPMKSYVLVNEEGMKTKKMFDYWMGLCLAFNSKAKASKKTARGKKHKKG